ncbi:MAG TPA: hypothetical protein DCY57_05910 [Bacteroidetes bacterium]|nr:hypothetical protein [Bacteroidota bacterium]
MSTSCGSSSKTVLPPEYITVPSSNSFHKTNGQMVELLTSGGVFMWPMTIIGLLMMALSAKVLMDTFSGSGENILLKKRNAVVLQLGVFLYFVGILSQALGLMQTFQVIQQIGDISPALLIGGLRVSMISPAYGLILFIISLILWSIARYKLT